MEHAAIIGFGCAGFHALKSMRESGYAGEIDVYDETAQAPCNPMLTTYYLQGQVSRSGLSPFGPPEELRRRYGCRHCLQRVARVTADRQVETAEGERRTYGRLLLATGAVPIVPAALRGLPGVFSLRTPADAFALEQALAGGRIRRAVVVGASMAGIKAAELLWERGVSCLLADLAPQLFPAAALPQMSREIELRLRSTGLELALGSGVGAVTPADGALCIAIGPRTVTADALVLCMGTRPRLDMLEEGGFHVDRALVVDDHMRTSVPGVYAAGDCCSAYDRQLGANRPLGLWHLAARQGAVAGRCMAGGEDAYAGELAQNTTHFFGMNFTSLGDNGTEGEDFIHAPAGEDWRLLIRVRDGIPVCINLLGKPELSGVLKSAMLKRTEERLPAGALCAAVLRRSGVPEKLIRLIGGELA